MDLSYPVTEEQLLLLPLSLSLFSLSLQGEDVSFHALTHILVLSHLTPPPSANEGKERRRGDRREVIGQKGREGVEREREWRCKGSVHRISDRSEKAVLNELCTENKCVV